MKNTVEISSRKKRLKTAGKIIGLVAALIVVATSAISMMDKTRLVEIVALCGGSFAAGVTFIQTVQWIRSRSEK